MWLPALLLAGAAGSPAPGPVASYQRSFETYDVPDIALLDQDGRQVRLAARLAGKEPVVLSFFFTTCGTICPVTAAGLKRMQASLAREGTPARFVSIAIDPEQDLPAALAEYSRRLGAAPEWDFLTGDLEAVARVRKAFRAYTPSKMSHPAVYFMRAAGSGPWLRIDGLAGGAELLREFRSLPALPAR